MSQITGVAVGRLPGFTITRRRERATARAAEAGAPARRRTTVACAALLAAEVIGSLLMWAPIPLTWMWIGARAYDATGSLGAGGAVTFLGFVASTALAMIALARIDALWIALRRRAGHDQRQGALTRVVVVSATLGLAAFFVWYYVLTRAFVIPFMPTG